MTFRLSGLRLKIKKNASFLKKNLQFLKSVRYYWYCISNLWTNLNK